MRVIAVLAQDWAAYCEQSNADDEFKPLYGWVVGLLVRETDEQVIIAHHWFVQGEPGNQVRHVTCVPRVCILRRQEFVLEATDLC